jgi:hypothetical protein
MADRSQYPGQIMETQTRYDLNTAIENWRAEFAASANLTAEVRRELETHLRDTIAGFQQRGLNDEESFWLACKRVGRPPQLGEEFVKADPAAIWREHIFWMAVGILVFWQLTLMITDTAGIALYYLTPSFFSFFQKNGFWLTDIAALIIGIMLAKGWLLQYLRPRWIIETRFRLVLLTAVLVALTTLTQTEVIREVQLNHSYYHSLFTWSAWFQLFGHLSLGYLEFSVAPLIFLILFFPKQNQKTSKRA